jgi:hypothetical protein
MTRHCDADPQGKDRSRTRRGRSSGTDNCRLGYVRLVVDTLMAVAFPLCRRRLYSEQHGAMRAYQQNGEGRTTVSQPLGRQAPPSEALWALAHGEHAATEERTAGAQSQSRQAGRLGNSVCSESHPGYVVRQLNLVLASAVTRGRGLRSGENDGDPSGLPGHPPEVCFPCRA